MKRGWKECVFVPFREGVLFAPTTIVARYTGSRRRLRSRSKIKAGTSEKYRGRRAAIDVILMYW